MTELNRARTRFVADLSHELRTPLALVMGPLEDLAARFLSAMGDEDRQRLAIIRTNVERLESLNDQLLDVARLEAERLPLRARCQDLAAFVASRAARFRDAAERKGLHFEVRVPELPIAIYFDPEMLDKVVTNLVGNAVKFTDRGAVSVAVSADPTANDEGFVRVEVADSGIGIPEHAQARLFERFYQVDRGDARRFEGVGIGLALVHDLVTLHGGEVGVTSTHGVGSTFWFALPRGADHLSLDDIDARSHAPLESPVAPMTPERNAPSAPEEADEETRPEVLIVEDHPDMRAYLALHLREHFVVREADGGAAALTAIALHRPAVIVSDVMMPGMDGLTLCRTLRADPATRDLPVVLVSAKAGEDDRVAGLAVAADYMTKPVRPRELVARVMRLVARPASPPLPTPPAHPNAPIGPITPAVPVAPVAPVAKTDDLARDGDGDDMPDLPPPELDALSARHLARIDALVATRLSDPDFGVSQLASALGSSRRQLQRELRRLTGRSPVQYLRAARMTAARERLRSGARDTVAEVAADVGMTPAYFSRIYTVWFGVAPSDDLPT